MPKKVCVKLDLPLKISHKSKVIWKSRREQRPEMGAIAII